MMDFLTNINWTPLITAIITALSGLLTFVWQAHIKPWLDSKRLTEAASVVVNGIEVLMRGSAGEAKLEAAIERLREMGFKLEEEKIRLAIEAAWNQMHIAQVAAGMKEKPPDPAE